MTTGKFSLINKDTVVSISVVISMLIFTVWTTSFSQNMQNETKNQKQEIEQLNKKIESLTYEFKTHTSKGVDGYPHPEGVIASMVQLKEGQTDRWRKSDDFLFMKEFSVLNNLKMPPHITLQESANKGTTVGK